MTAFETAPETTETPSVPLADVCGMECVLPSNRDLLRLAVVASPGERTVQQAFRDCLMEEGVKPRTAARLVNSAVREGEVRRWQARVDDRSSSKLRTRVRTAAGHARSVAPIEVRDGDDPPRVEGEAAYSTFKTGGVCNNPGGAIRAGYKVVYHASTLVVIVGSGWLKRYGQV